MHPGLVYRVLAGQLVAKILADADSLCSLGARTPSAKMLSQPFTPRRPSMAEEDVPEVQSLLVPDVSQLLPAELPWGEGPAATAIEVAREERRAVDSINSLLDQLEEQKLESQRALRSSQVGSFRILRIKAGMSVVEFHHWCP